MPECRQIPRNRRKTRSGCTRCKERRIKCDETSPACNQCTRRGYECPGLRRPLKWSSKHETNQILPEMSNIEDLVSVIPSQKCQTRTPQLSGSIEGNSASTKKVHPDVDQLSLEWDSSNDNMITLNDQNNSRLTSLFSSHATSWDEIFTIDDQQEQNDTCESQAIYDTMLIPDSLNNRESSLSVHYFSIICRINCAVDSSSNPFRSWVVDNMESSALLKHCVLSMSAAHLAESDTELRLLALEHKSQAVSQLEGQIFERTAQKSRQITSVSTATSSFMVLFSCILLGMTESWHHPAMLGLGHLHSARALFQRWNARFRGSSDLDRNKDPTLFLVGMLAYWEAMASFVRDQPLNATSYLSPFLELEGGDDFIVPPNPWTGVSTTLFIYLSRVACLGRHRETLKRLDISNLSPEMKERLHENHMKQARELETALLRYRIPPLEKVERTDDIQTPTSHLQTVARIYRLTTLMEIYRSFPELLSQDATKTDGYECGDNSSRLESSWFSKILSLATSILTLISTLPADSGSNVIISLPLIVAGSALQSPSPSTKSEQCGLFAEVVSIHNEEGVHVHWRSFVKERFKTIYSFVGLSAVLRGLEVVERTWARADLQRLALQQDFCDQFVNWTDVMTEERLETIFG